MAKKSKKYLGIYSVKGKRGISYGIDYVHPQTAQRVRKILKGVTSEAEAARMRNIELADAARGAINMAYSIKDKPIVLSFEAMVKAYLEWARENRKDWKGKEYIADPLIKAFKGKLVSEINPFMVEKYKMAKAKVLKKSTVNKHLSMLRQIFEKAIDWDKFDGPNPLEKVKQFKVDRGKKPGALTPEEETALLDEIKHPVRRDMVDFAFQTGWRISEIRNLSWEDVDLESGIAWILDPKNGQSAEIELNDEALEIIRRQPQRSEFVFCMVCGKPYTTNCFAGVHEAAKRAGVVLPKGKAWHAFRITWATLMHQNGADIPTLQ